LKLLFSFIFSYSLFSKGHPWCNGKVVVIT